MSATVDRRADRRAATRAEIMAAAWRLAGDRGVAGWTMRDLGAEVGMRAQSLYVYFESKTALLDAMFAAGFAELRRRVEGLAPDADPVAGLRSALHCFVDFAVEDQARYQLLFQRNVPGFEPAAESYAESVRSLAVTRAQLAACGITGPADVDLYTAIGAGLVAQQNSNEPGGQRWTRLVDTAFDVYISHVERTRS